MLSASSPSRRERTRACRPRGRLFLEAGPGSAARAVIPEAALAAWGSAGSTSSSRRLSSPRRASLMRSWALTASTRRSPSTRACSVETRSRAGSCARSAPLTFLRCRSATAARGPRTACPGSGTAGTSRRAGHLHQYRSRRAAGRRRAWPAGRRGTSSWLWQCCLAVQICPVSVLGAAPGAREVARQHKTASSRVLRHFCRGRALFDCARRPRLVEGT